MPDLNYDLIIVGASLGGTAAALRAASMNASVCILEASDWIGGQFTGQGITKPDENRFVETVGSTESYRAFRHAVRLHYRSAFHLSLSGERQPAFNPGGAYPGFSMEPRAGHNVLLSLLAASPKIHVRLNTRVTAAQTDEDRILSVTAVDTQNVTTRYTATYFLDATDLGDLLPLVGAEYRLGAESRAETGEPEAPAQARPDWVQPISLPIALERRPPGEDHTIAEPPGYAALKTAQNYTLKDGYISTMFVPGKDLWSYRRFIDAMNFDDPAFPHDLSMLNMGANDYQAATLPTGDPVKDQAVIEGARQASRGYLYWLQTECPRDDDPRKKGFPELKPRGDLFGTADGTSALPYIRESRRIEAVKTVVQQDIDSEFNSGPRAKLFLDSCGIGLYGGMDIHGLASVGMPQRFIPIKPFQIPLGALIPKRITNLIAACKNIGVTHITNGAYRLHPVEWNTGESAGALAAFAIDRDKATQDVWKTPELLRTYQNALLDAGVPLFWWSDITSDNRTLFSAVNMLGVNGIMSGYEDMSYRPNQLLTAAEQREVEDAVGHALSWPSDTLSRGDAALWLTQTLHL